MQVKILVADDHKVFREGIISLLQHIPELCVVAEAGSAEEAISETKKLGNSDFCLIRGAVITTLPATSIDRCKADIKTNAPV